MPKNQRSATELSEVIRRTNELHKFYEQKSIEHRARAWQIKNNPHALKKELYWEKKYHQEAIKYKKIALNLSKTTKVIQQHTVKRAKPPVTILPVRARNSTKNITKMLQDAPKAPTKAPDLTGYLLQKAPKAPTNNPLVEEVKRIGWNATLSTYSLNTNDIFKLTTDLKKEVAKQKHSIFPSVPKVDPNETDSKPRFKRK